MPKDGPLHREASEGMAANGKKRRHKNHKNKLKRCCDIQKRDEREMPIYLQKTKEKRP